MQTIIEHRPTIGAHYLNADGAEAEMRAIGPTHVVVRMLGYHATSLRIITRDEFDTGWHLSPTSNVEQLELFAGG